MHDDKDDARDKRASERAILRATSMLDERRDEVMRMKSLPDADPRDAEIARLRADLKSALIERDANYSLSEIRRRETIGVSAERDAALAKIAAHNERLLEGCAKVIEGKDRNFRCPYTANSPKPYMCSNCPRRHRIEVDG